MTTVYKADLYGITLDYSGGATVSSCIRTGELFEVTVDSGPELYVRLGPTVMVSHDESWKDSHAAAAADLAAKLRRVSESINEKVLELTLEEVAA